MVFVAERVGGASSGRVIWCDVLDNRHTAGGYNHPGDLRRIGSTVVIAGQNWAGTTNSKIAVMFGGDAMNMGNGGNHALFYDVSDPTNPFYFGKLNHSWDGDTIKFAGVPKDSWWDPTIDAITAAEVDGRYYLSVNGMSCWSDAFTPDAPWTFISTAGMGSPSPIVFDDGTSGMAYENGREVKLHALDASANGLAKGALKATWPVFADPGFASGWTWSLNTIAEGTTVGVIADVESDSVIRIAEVFG